VRAVNIILIEDMMALYTPYPPDMFYTTYLHKSFPEHHYPLEHSRHRVGTFLKSLYEEPPYAVPKADVRESTNTFFIDVELPGLETAERLKLTWTNSRTLMIEARLTRPPLPAAEISTSEKEEEQGSKLVEAKTASNDKDGKDTMVQESGDARAVHVTVHERWQGLVERAFYFPVDVSHDGLKASLRGGLLRLTIPKVETENPINSKIEVV
jgi:HSP20 family molecular chaperone IbpA